LKTILCNIPNSLYHAAPGYVDGSDKPRRPHYRCTVALPRHAHPYPLSGTDTATAFAIHVRRILDNSAIHTKFALDGPFRHWSPAHGLIKVAFLREALNRIVHATEFEVGFEQLPAANIEGAPSE
jgi:hypothetical protein